MWGGQGDGQWGLAELCSAPIHPRLAEPVNALAFDPLEEALWAGTDGAVAQLAAPSLERYAAVPTSSPVLELRALGEGVVSLTAFELAVHSSGGAPRLSWADKVRPTSRPFPCPPCQLLAW